MPIFKAVNEKYHTEKDMANLVNYAIRNDKCVEGIYGAQGIMLGTAHEMSGQMKDIRQFYHKNTKRYALQFILSFSREEEKFIGLKEALEIGYLMAECFQGWQVVFGVHTDTDNLHIHFVINTTSYENGKSISIGIQSLQMLQAAASNIVKNYYAATLPEEERTAWLMNRFQ